MVALTHGIINNLMRSNLSGINHLDVLITHPSESFFCFFLWGTLVIILSRNKSLSSAQFFIIKLVPPPQQHPVDIHISKKCPLLIAHSLPNWLLANNQKCFPSYSNIPPISLRQSGHYFRIVGVTFFSATLSKVDYWRVLF